MAYLKGSNPFVSEFESQLEHMDDDSLVKIRISFSAFSNISYRLHHEFEVDGYYWDCLTDEERYAYVREEAEQVLYEDINWDYEVE